jgi:hypothetical protein
LMAAMAVLPPDLSVALNPAVALKPTMDLQGEEGCKVLQTVRCCGQKELRGVLLQLHESEICAVLKSGLSCWQFAATHMPQGTQDSCRTGKQCCTPKLPLTGVC